MYNPVRGGNRGGRDQFTWDEIRLLPFKERECYLGSTVKIGYLDKGGRWRMRDWWTKTDDGPSDKNAMSAELRRVQAEDDRRMREALGLETRQVDNGPHLSEYELHELTKKNRDDAPEVEEAERMPGLGFNPGTAKFKAVDMNQVYDQTDYTKLDGEGVRNDDVRRNEKQDRKARREEVSKVIKNDLPVVGGVLDASKKIKKDKKKKEKKDKKDKKEKKEKKHKKKEKRDKERREEEGDRERRKHRDDSEERDRDRKRSRKDRSRHDDSD